MANTRAQTHADPNDYRPPTLNHPDQVERTELAQTNGPSRLPLQTPDPCVPPLLKPSLEPQTRSASPSQKRQCEGQDASEKPEHRAFKRARPSDRNLQSQHDSGTDETDPIAYWVRKGRWPARYKQDPEMEGVLARRKFTPGWRHSKRSEPSCASSVTPSDQRPREEKGAPYLDPRYATLLETKGSFMHNSELGITDESKLLCRTLLEGQQQTPKDSLFSDDIFEVACQKVDGQNEARVLRDFTPLIVPSAENLATHGAKELGCLIERINGGWNNSVPLTGVRPQTDYSVGFTRSAFSDAQLKTLLPFIGDLIARDQSLFMATYEMYFPFLTCEVKCGTAGLDIADRQNAHSMTLAVRSIVELFRLVGREKEVNRHILAFSLSHNDENIRIYGHYAVVQDRDNTKYYRHPIKKLAFTDPDGKDKWTAYRFTRNVYDLWMPAHFARICSAIDELPAHLDFTVPPLAESGISQELESRHPLES